MADNRDIEAADRLGRRRARAMPVLAVIFFVQQASHFLARIEDGPGSVDRVKVGSWLILSIALLLALIADDFWFHPRRVRVLLNDEVTRSNRLEGMRVGFIAAMVAGIAIYLAALVEPIAGRDAVHLLMTIGLGAGFLRFGQLEWRAYRGD